MNRGFICLGLSVILAGSVPLSAQNFTGTYTVRAPAGNVVTLVLRQNPDGTIQGELSGNETIVQIAGRLEGGNLVGTATSGGMKGFAAASLSGDSLQFMLADFGPDGKPNFATAQAIVLMRGAAASAAPPAAAPSSRTPAQAPPASGADQQLAQLLQSSPWCSFQYNQTSGRTSTSRYIFRPDGTVTFGSNSEGGTVNQFGGGSVNLGGGATGSVYGQSQGGGRLRWKVQRGMLHLDDGKGFQPVALNVTRNSSGYPIITADGTEYSQCN
jgi:hypothetical protein